MKKVILLISLFNFFNTSALSLKEMTNEDGVIWGFDFLNKNEVIYSLKSGKLYHKNLITNKKTELNAPKAKVTGQGGLLDVFIDKTTIYLTFADQVGEHTTTSLASGQYKDKKILNLKTIFKANVYGKTGRHFGSRLEKDGKYLFMTIGDRGDRDYAQKLNFHNGTIVRLNLDGSTPKDNPFYNKKGALKEIWSYGHRNPQGIAKDPISGDLYSCEFGPRGGDELNLILDGR